MVQVLSLKGLLAKIGNGVFWPIECSGKDRMRRENVTRDMNREYNFAELFSTFDWTCQYLSIWPQLAVVPWANDPGLWASDYQQSGFIPGEVTK